MSTTKNMYKTRKHISTFFLLFFAIICFFFPRPYTLANPPTSMLIITAEGLADPNARTYKNDRSELVTALRQDSKQQVIEKAIGVLVDNPTFLKNYALIQNRVYKKRKNLITNVIKESKPWLGNDGLMHILVKAKVDLVEVKALLTKIEHSNGISLLTKQGNLRLTQASKLYELQVSGFPDYDTGILFKKELIGLRHVFNIDFRDYNAELSRFEVEFISSAGNITQFVQNFVVLPLNSKFSEQAFSLGSIQGNVVKLNFNSHLDSSTVANHFNSKPPSSLTLATYERIKSLIKSKAAMQKLLAINPNANTPLPKYPLNSKTTIQDTTNSTIALHKKEKFRLSINTSPENSHIRILNIRPKYSDGIKLVSGKYKVEISKKGFKKLVKWIKITNKDVVHSIELQPLVAQKPAVQNNEVALLRAKLERMEQIMMQKQSSSTINQHRQPVGRRVALVVGNSKYQHTAPLPNPTNDAKAIGESLKRMGFDTEIAIDVTKAKFDTALRQFANRLVGSQAAAFYYAGHGIQNSGKNYLVPIDAQLKTNMDVKWETVVLDMILGEMEAEDRVNLVFLDACRNNPMTRSWRQSRGGSTHRGLVRIKATSAGTLISYATTDGQTADDGDGHHSPYTEALLKHIETPGIEVEKMLKRVRLSVHKRTNGQQIPWDYGSLLGEFYMVP